MTETEKLSAMEDIRQLRAKYWRGVDSHDGALVRSILAEDCVLDYNGCMTDPTSGVDHMPVMNLALEGRDSWQTDNLEGPRIVTVHTGHQYEIDITSDTTAAGIWYFTDRFFMPEGGPFSRFVGYGRYHETYEKTADGWKLKTTRIERIWVESH
jgi:hypothetical protein